MTEYKKINLCCISNIMAPQVTLYVCVHVSVVLCLGKSGQSGSVKKGAPQQVAALLMATPGQVLASRMKARLSPVRFTRFAFLCNLFDSQAVESCRKQNPNPTQKASPIDPVHHLNQDALFPNTSSRFQFSLKTFHSSAKLYSYRRLYGITSIFSGNAFWKSQYSQQRLLVLCHFPLRFTITAPASFC